MEMQNKRQNINCTEEGLQNPDDMTERLNQIGQEILCAARDELYLGMRFLDVALSSFVYQMDSEVSPFGTDGAVMYFHPRELGGLYRQNRILVNRGYLHMVYHCLFRHMLKIIPLQECAAKNDLEKVENSDQKDWQTVLREGQSKEPENDDRWKTSVRYWNLACDIAVEHLIDSNYHRSVRFSRSLLRRETYRRLEGNPAGFGEAVGMADDSDGSHGSGSYGKGSSRHKKRVLNAERIYRELLIWNLSEKELAKLIQEFHVDDHRYWENKDPEQKPPNPDLNRKWQDINERMETDLETFSKEASEKSGELLGQLVIENREKQNYREFLRKVSVIREEVGIDADTFDYTFYSYGLSLYGNMPLIEPQETREVKKVRDFVVVIDTSMSCSGETVRRFLETTYDVLSGNDNFFQKVNVHVIQCDEAVQTDVKITCEEELRNYMESLILYGEGGTDFRPAFAYVDELVRSGEFEDLRGLIYLTDGYGVYPQKMPGYQVAFVLPAEDYAEVNVPAWAIKTELEETELK